MTEMTKEQITEKLDAAGIEYDGRLGAEKLAELLPKDAPKGETITCNVLRDFWPTDDENDRVRKGAVIEVSVEKALDGIEAGALQRVKD